MKFDVLKSMMSKASAQQGKKALELGEGKKIASQIEQAHAQLTSTLEAFSRSRLVLGHNCAWNVGTMPFS